MELFGKRLWHDRFDVWLISVLFAISSYRTFDEFFVHERLIAALGYLCLATVLAYYTFQTGRYSVGFLYAKQGRDLLNRGDNSEAVAPLKVAHRLFPGDAVVPYHLGIALARSGEIEEALRFFTEAAALDSFLEGARQGRAHCLHRLGHPSAADSELAELANLRTIH
jgi:tetratricopeptide (TPR) repeat protein